MLSFLVPLSGVDETRPGSTLYVGMPGGSEESSLAYPRSHSFSEKILAFPTWAFPMTHAFPAPGCSSLGALLSSQEHMWIGKDHKIEKRLGSREVI